MSIYKKKRHMLSTAYTLMKGYVAVQRKLLCMCYTLWKKQEDFENDYQTENKKVENSESPLHDIEIL